MRLECLVLAAAVLAPSHAEMSISRAPSAPLIDAYAEPAVWSGAEVVGIHKNDGSAGRFQSMWDDDALYLYIEVDDDKRVFEPDNWKGADDGVELYLNTANERSTRFGIRDRRYTFRYSDGEFQGTTSEGVRFAQAHREPGYRMEIRLPWTAVGPPVGPIGLNVCVNDDDDGGAVDVVHAWHGENCSTPGSFLSVRLNGLRSAAARPREPRRNGTVIFSDDFGSASRGEIIENVVHLPPPKGLGYTTRYPKGYRPLNWTQIDERPAGDPRKGFWIVPVSEDVLVQAGRSIPSLLFANTPIPEGTAGYDITFFQRRNDNDPIGFIVGASTPGGKHDGVEFSYETQVPGSDKTTTHMYIKGALGEGIRPDQAFMRHWVEHRIEVRGKHIRWFQGDRLIAEGSAPNLRSGGYFGIRHVSERDTAYARRCHFSDRAKPGQLSPTIARRRLY